MGLCVFLDNWRTERIYVFLLAAIQFVHIVDFVILMPLGPTLMIELGVSSTQFASLVSSYNFSAAISGLVFSSIADRYDRKKLLLIAQAGFLIGVMLCFNAANFEKLLTARILTGFFGGILTAIIYAIVSDLIPYERRGKAMGVIMSAFSIASVLGIPIGLAIADSFGWHKVFALTSAMTLLLFFLCVMIIPSRPQKVVKRSFFDAIKQYFLVLVKPRYLYAHFFIFLVGTSMFLIIPFLSPYAVRNIGIQTTDLKYMYFIAGLCTILTARLFGHYTDIIGAKKMFVILCSVSIFPVLFYTNAPEMNLFAFILMSTFFMTLVSGRMIPCMTLLSEVPRSEDRGSFMGILNAVRSFGSAFATLVGGWIITEDMVRGTEMAPLVGFNYVGWLSVSMIFLTILGVFALRVRDSSGVNIPSKLLLHDAR